jgi:hypothetical protein
MKRFYCNGKKDFCHRGYTNGVNCDGCKHFNDKGGEEIDDTAEAPVKDMVEVVRCKDCKHRYSSEFCECRPDDAFCSDGERRTE